MSSSNVTPDRVLSGLVKEPTLLWEVLWNAKILGPWEKQIIHRKGEGQLEQWTRGLHPRLRGSSPVQILEVPGGFKYHLDLDGDGDLNRTGERGSLSKAQACADELLGENGWALIMHPADVGMIKIADADDAVNATPQIREVYRLLGEGRAAFQTWAKDYQTLRAASESTANLKTFWRKFMRDDAMPRNHAVRDLLNEVFTDEDARPTEIEEFLNYVEEYDRLMWTWTDSDADVLFSGQNFPTDIEPYIQSLAAAQP
ncbi:hypothetical protein N9917_00345 [Deltaproteobacteria bacterium]|nr:hypothetical protein [Deltaproteobacteria bacterium]